MGRAGQPVRTSSSLQDPAVAALAAGWAGRAHHAEIDGPAVPRDVAVRTMQTGGPRRAAAGAAEVSVPGTSARVPVVPVLVPPRANADLEVAVRNELETDRSHRARAVRA